MLPVVAIVGRPNVGKSTLFNRLTRSRSAVISDYAGTTRDRQYGEVKLYDRRFIIIDTGGLTEETDHMGEMITQQAQVAILDADKILFLVDARAGIMPEDRLIAKSLRRTGKPVFLAANKAEGLDAAVSLTDFYELGLGAPMGIAASHGSGIEAMVNKLFPEPNEPDIESEGDNDRIKIAIIGRPNVGKSTLTNRMLGEDRVIVDDAPGTTRDSIFIPLDRLDKKYTLIDTAGVRKRKKMADVPEKFSVVKTLQAIENTHVVLFIIDGRLGVSDQDLKLLGFVLECGKALVIAVNKWDGMTDSDRDQARATLDRNLNFTPFARIHYISALHGSNVGHLFSSVDEAYESANRKLSTPELTRLLQKAIVTHSPPLVQGRRIKLRYAHAGGHNPPLIIIHGNQLPALPESYKRFLANFFQTKLNLHGTPVHVEFKSSENPFAKK